MLLGKTLEITPPCIKNQEKAVMKRAPQAKAITAFACGALFIYKSVQFLAGRDGIPDRRLGCRLFFLVRALLAATVGANADNA